MKHIVCLSGGESSAVVALEVVQKYGKDNVILINHDIHPNSELADVKRFKEEISKHLDVPITYANHPEWDKKDQFDVCVDAKSFVSPQNRTILCTHRLKTQPFYTWLKQNYEEGDVIYYGFDASEPHRITRRSAILGKDGYASDYPLALWRDRTFFKTKDVGIDPPLQYAQFNHANCIGCLKAGWQHWYVVYCLYPEVWEKAKQTEEEIKYSVHKDYYFVDKEPMFEAMKNAGIEPTEKVGSGRFWATARKAIGAGQINLFELPTQENAVECMGDCGIDRD